jgi:FMN phosphatase YigB (HAD superfamily)
MREYKGARQVGMTSVLFDPEHGNATDADVTVLSWSQLAELVHRHVSAAP